MRRIFTILLGLTFISSSFGQADLSDIDEVRSRLNTYWGIDENTDSGSHFRFLFTEDYGGKLIGANVPFNALEFKLIFENDRVQILWFNSSGRCLSSEILVLGEYLEIKFKEQIQGFKRHSMFRSIGCPNF